MHANAVRTICEYITTRLTTDFFELSNHAQWHIDVHLLKAKVCNENGSRKDSLATLGDFPVGSSMNSNRYSVTISSP
jgi:hypothetical protein